MNDDTAQRSVRPPDPGAGCTVLPVPDALPLHALRRREPRRFPFLLESAISGRFDLLIADPAEAISLRGQVLEGAPGSTDFFEALSMQAHDARCAPVPGLPFCGGWFLYLGYEMARHAEPVLQLPAPMHGLPDALAVRCRSAVVRDRRRGTTTVVSEMGAAHARELAELARGLRPGRAGREPVIEHVMRPDPSVFTGGVVRIQDYLRAGDVFQVNLSRRWIVRCREDVDVDAAYAHLRRNNPAPFAGLMSWEGASVLSSSPERLIRMEGDVVETCPIAGTHPRHANPAEDAALRRRLTADLKERSEHVMLLDLERNDLGRICRSGSVRVDDMMHVQSFAHVHHIVSRVSGRLREGIGPGAVIRAVFPGGTITGCPKIRAMQIIAELEQVGRGPYTGSMGYLSRCGSMDLNILIRTLVVERNRICLSTGAGVVADSEPEAELAETNTKALGPLRAIGVEP